MQGHAGRNIRNTPPTAIMIQSTVQSQYKSISFRDLIVNERNL